MDPYKTGAARVYEVTTDEVSREQRQRYKTAFYETWWMLLRSNENVRRTQAKQIEIIEQGVRDGWSDDRIKKELIAAAEADEAIHHDGA